MHTPPFWALLIHPLKLHLIRILLLFTVIKTTLDFPCFFFFAFILFETTVIHSTASDYSSPLAAARLGPLQVSGPATAGSIFLLSDDDNSPDRSALHPKILYSSKNAGNAFGVIEDSPC
jgi:hypothetical protein